MRKGAVTLLAVVTAGLVALAIVAAQDRRSLAFTLGVVPAEPAAVVPPGHVACQRPIDASAAFDSVAVTAAAGAGPLKVTVTPAGGGSPLGAGTLPRSGGQAAAVPVGHVAGDQAIAVCVRNAGRRPATLIGNAAAAAPGTATVDGRTVPTDLALTFQRRRPQSFLSLIPAMFRRAALFRGLGIGGWTYWLLLALVVVAVPGLGAWAVSRAAAESRR